MDGPSQQSNYPRDCWDWYKNAGAPQGDPGLFGAGTTIRTRDLLITNQLLYQLSYAG